MGKISQPVLVINTYAGSLLLGARLAGAEVVASLEDCGFGQAQARANFPKVDHVPCWEDWPDRDLSGHLVIAHPPCAAFSVQAKGTRVSHGSAFGLESEHFEETRRVVRYALSHGATSLAVESVPGAYEGARSAHDELAAEHGYSAYRLLQNAATFGVPQWRPRFWIVFTRAVRFAAWHVPRYTSLSDALDNADRGCPDDEIAKTFKAQYEALAGSSFNAKKMLSTPGMLARNIQRDYRPGESLNDIAGKYCTAARGKKTGGSVRIGHRWVSATPRVLDPDGTAPVVMHDSWFIYRGRPLTPNEYKTVMGFPQKYVLDGAYRQWLSKGVVPAVAAWVLKLMACNITGDTPRDASLLSPGDTADFRIGRSEWRDRAAGKGPTSPRPATHKPAPPVKPRTARAPAARKTKHVIVAYELLAPIKTDTDQVDAAFRSKNNLVWPPLKERVLRGFTGKGKARRAAVGIVAQYEPPNSGGHKQDVDRIVARAAKKLGAEWRRA